MGRALAGRQGHAGNGTPSAPLCAAPPAERLPTVPSRIPSKRNDMTALTGSSRLLTIAAGYVGGLVCPSRGRPALPSRPLAFALVRRFSGRPLYQVRSLDALYGHPRRRFQRCRVLRQGFGRLDWPARGFPRLLPGRRPERQSDYWPRPWTRNELLRDGLGWRPCGNGSALRLTVELQSRSAFTPALRL